MRMRKLAAVTAALAPLALAAPVAGASAATTPPASAAAPVFTFIPPRVGPLQVIMGATYIGGKLISPGVNVSTPGVNLPAITWSPPAS
jgi:hypothetical protein